MVLTRFARSPGLEIASKPTLKGLVDQEDHGRTGRRSRNSHAASSVQPGDPSTGIDPFGNAPEFGPLTDKLAIRPTLSRSEFFFRLHGGFDTVGREQDNVVAHPGTSTSRHQFKRAEILLGYFRCRASGIRLLLFYRDESPGNSLVRAEPGGGTSRLAEQCACLSEPKALQSVRGDSGSDNCEGSLEFGLDGGGGVCSSRAAG